MKNHTLISVILIAVVFLVALSFFSPFRHHTKTTIEAPALPDAYMEDVVALILDKQGKPKMKIAAPKMVYYSNDDQTHLTSPQLTIYRKSPQPWYVTAKSAIATQGTEYVHFQEDVMIQHAADSSNPATIIKTATLLVRPNTQLAETNDPIILIQPNVTIKGTGMRADMNNGDIKLLSEARGEYVPG
jgi:lipopolysaccharide export system protein LptC